MFFYNKNHIFLCHRSLFRAALTGIFVEIKKSDFLPVMGKAYANNTVKIKRSSVSRNANINQLIELAKCKKFIELSKNQVLFREGEPVKGVYFLLTGKIEISYKNSDNTQSVLYTIKSPDIIGLHSIMEEDFYIHTAIAVSDSMICFMPKEEFERILAQNSKIALNLMKMLCLKITVIQNQIHKHN
jgi:CRP-like cAMP-binding protein